jgi:antitoxin component YwqK of YwqJK toxin-antitoxin module
MKNKDIKPRNENNQPHGYWEQYHVNGQLWYKGNYVNGIRHGYWEQYHVLWYKGNYVNGKEDGYWEDYYSNGQLENKTYYI